MEAVEMGLSSTITLKGRVSEMKNALKRKSFLFFSLAILWAAAMLGGCDSTQTNDSGASGAVAETAAEVPAPAEEISFTLNISYSGGLYEALMRDIAAKAEELSGGRIKGNIIASGTMGSEREVGEAVQLGTLDMAYLSDNVAETLIGGLSWAWLPFMISTYEEADKYYNTGWIREELWKKMAEAHLIGIAVCENGFRNYGNTVKAVTGQAEFRGQKVRVPEQPDLIKFYQLCGALPVAISGSEVITALEQKTIDAVDNTIYNFHANGYIDTLKYITVTNHQYTSNNIVVSPAFWNALSEEDRGIIRQAAEYACARYTATRRSEEEDVIKACKASGYTFVEPDEKFQAELKMVARQIWAEFKVNYDPKIISRIQEQFGHKMD